MTGVEWWWEHLAELYLDNGNPLWPENVLILHLAAEWAEIDILEHQHRLVPW